jgi:hypothetical protein
MSGAPLGFPGSGTWPSGAPHSAPVGGAPYHHTAAQPLSARSHFAAPQQSVGPRFAAPGALAAHAYAMATARDGAPAAAAQPGHHGAQEGVRASLDGGGVQAAPGAAANGAVVNPGGPPGSPGGMSLHELSVLDEVAGDPELNALRDRLGEADSAYAELRARRDEIRGDMAKFGDSLAQVSDRLDDLFEERAAVARELETKMGSRVRDAMRRVSSGAITAWW